MSIPPHALTVQVLTILPEHVTVATADGESFVCPATSFFHPLTVGQTLTIVPTIDLLPETDRHHLTRLVLNRWLQGT